MLSRQDERNEDGYRDCNLCGKSFNLYADNEGLLNLEEILDCSEQQQQQWQSNNPRIDLTGYFCSDCAKHTIQQIENVDDDNPNSVGYYGYNQKTDNYYPNLDD